MPLVNTKDMFLDAYKNNYAVGAFNVDSIAMIQAVLLAAEKLKSPVIISLSKGSREFMHPGNIKEQILCVSKDITIPFAIHLDHGKSVELCKDCIDEGFTSVMIDASAYDFEENIRQTKEVVEYAHKHNVTVEGELAILTTKEDYPALIEEFVKRTNVDSLAISIGTGHGTTKFKKGEVPHLDFDILDFLLSRSLYTISVDLESLLLSSLLPSLNPPLPSGCIPLLLFPAPILLPRAVSPLYLSYFLDSASASLAFLALYSSAC